MVDSVSKIPALEKMLKSGGLTIVLVYADWCGACSRFKQNVWGPSCKENALHNRIGVRDDMVRKTSLANAKFDYLPSLLVVDEKGEMQEFKTPEGKATNAMPTPKSVEEMSRVMNVSLKPVANRTPTPYPSPSQNTPMETKTPTPYPSPSQNTPIEGKTLVPAPATPTPEVMKISNAEIEKAENAKTPEPSLGTPEGKTFTPSPMTVPMQKGGSLLQTLLDVSRGNLPVLNRWTLKGRKTQTRRLQRRRG